MVSWANCSEQGLSEMRIGRVCNDDWCTLSHGNEVSGFGKCGVPEMYEGITTTRMRESAAGPKNSSEG